MATLGELGSTAAIGGAMAGIGYNRPERDARTRAQTGRVAGRGAGGGEVGGEVGGVRAAALECPSCHRSDQVRAVPAVCLSGHRRFGVVGSGGDEQRTETREVVPHLADALAPIPPAPVTGGRTALGVLLVLVAIGTFIGGAAGGKWFADAPKSAPEAQWAGGGAHSWETRPDAGAELLFLGWISAFALVGAVLLIRSTVRIRRAFQARIAAGQEAAEEVWARGWCCERCAAVHFAGGPAMSLQEFRTQVWDAGGYGDLARVYRVTGRAREVDPAPGY
ncbi:hypothetical protein OG625_34145 [Streptomyces sp. NBC_01351]|uniref:hypothetical protein n=1 Tax=Streptomyces sp. NBC_01351 TaxID=2903833 RepID=UPI002E3513A9|nr:hypothetical protein [Streptomyces sp. NBC_01351]